MSRANRLHEARELNYRICQLDPDNADAWHNVGYICMQMNDFQFAESAARRSISISPKRPAPYTVLGASLQKQYRYGEALVVYKHALKLKKENSHVYNNIGEILKLMGDPEGAVQSFRHAQKLLAKDVCHSNILLSLNYFDCEDPIEVFQEHQSWGRRFGNLRAGRHKFANVIDTERQLRIGYVSADFRDHSVAWFLEPILAHHEKKMFHITCYSAVAIPDDTTARLHGQVDEWRNIFKQPDEQVVGQIRNDGIDILVDLSGHTVGNRLKMFTHKPAPVQITYLGYPNTTGIHAIDYRLTDSWADPPGMTDQYYCEKLERLPQGFLCYQPPADAPEVGLSPFTNNGYITFGSFNNLAKITPAVVSAWAAILKKLPNARLLIKTHSFADPGTREIYQTLFNDAGVDAGRVELRGPANTTPYHLSMYGEIDIALDPFPYNGTTTTCEALWMGVPVMVVAGETHAGRVGVSLLSQVGLDEYIAGNVDEYISKAVQLAEHVVTVQHSRKALRDRVANSALCDAESFTHALEKIYRKMWYEWCKNQTSDKGL